MIENKRVVEKDAPLKKDYLILIIGNLILYFKNRGFINIRAVDKIPLFDWYLHVPGAENLCMDVLC